MELDGLHNRGRQSPDAHQKSADLLVRTADELQFKLAKRARVPVFPFEQVGAYLMSVWGLPASIVQAVQFHHNPSMAQRTEFSALTAVHCADAIVSAKDGVPLNHDSELDAAHLAQLGLFEKLAVWREFHEEYLAAKADRDAAASTNLVAG